MDNGTLYMGGSRKLEKKMNAQAHNIAFEIKDSIFTIGACCKCPDPLFMYMKSNDENICNYYCNGKCEIHFDIRNPRDGDIFFFPLSAIKDILILHYGEEKLEKLYEN